MRSQRDERLRLFVAIELPEAWRQALADEARQLESAAPGVGRWVDPHRMHLTLVFLNSQPATVLSTIADTVERAAATSPPLTLSPGPLGAFGGPRSIRVIWAGVEDRPPGALAALRERLVQALSAARIAFEADPFHPHVTLARARRDATPAQSEAMHRAVLRRGAASPPVAAHASASARCEAITLMRSDLGPAGPVYTPVQRARLGARAVGPDA
ncbi:MAG: RNA 2',3'-cyclic phosphodiesterase [Chloroflexi bacterium]|nr:RNA 2',3'-cyclic phosphodiesterase [Chloroflexota bacterium]